MMQGPGLMLVQFLSPEPPFNQLETLADWAAGLGYKGLQIPTFWPHIFDLAQAAESQTYCDDVEGMLADRGLVVTELSTHRQGHVVVSNPAYDLTLEDFGPPDTNGNRQARQEWARGQLLLAAQAAGRLGLTTHATFSGSLSWPFIYPYPPRPAGLVEEGFDELARVWRPILDAFDEHGIDVCFEIHPGEDLFDGWTFEMLLDRLDGHPRCNILYDPSHMLLQQMDYLGFIDLYHERIKAFHVKDAEFNGDARGGAYGGFQSWTNRAGRFRSLGDGQVDFVGIFSKLAQYGYDGWAVLEWECYLKHPDDGAGEGAAFIRDHMIRTTEHAFDDFMRATTDSTTNRQILGLA